MKRLLLFGLLALCGFSGMAADGDFEFIPLCPFGKGLNQWHVRKNTHLEQVTGDYAAKMTIEKYAKGQERWPAIIAKVPAELKDWSYVESLEFDAVSETGDGYLAVRINTEKSFKNYGRQQIPTNPVHVIIPVGKHAKELQYVKDVHLFQQDPEHVYVFQLADLKLKVRVNFVEAFREMQAKLDECRPAASAALLAMEKKLAGQKKISRQEHEAFATLVEACYLPYQKKLVADAGNANYTARWITPYVKLLREDNVGIRHFGEYEISAARGEGESAQIMIYAKTALKNLSVKVAKNFRSADGAEIPASAVELAPLGFVDCPKPNYYDTPHVGWWPDPILSYAEKLDLEADKYQPWWLDVYVPENQKPGLYEGSVLVTADGAPAQVLPIRLKVRNFVLPVGKTAYPLNISYSGAGCGARMPENHPIKTNPEAWNKRVWDTMLQNRLGCDSLYHSHPMSAADAKYKLDHGAQMFNICYVGMDIEKRFPLLDKAMEEYKKLGILDKAYFYCFDEVPASKHTECAVVLQKLRTRYPGIPIFTTAYDHSYANPVGSPLRELIDWWCPLTPKYEDNLAQAKIARERGRKVFWYICCAPTGDYANIFIERSPLQGRLIMGMMYQKYKPDGFLYYGVNRWREGLKSDAPLRDKPVMGAPCTNWTGNSFCLFNGDGLLFYPGEKELLQAVRQKYMRDGMDDALYFQYLEKALAKPGKTSAVWRKAVEKELVVEPEIVTDMKHYTNDPDLMQAKRERLAKLIEEYEAAR